MTAVDPLDIEPTYGCGCLIVAVDMFGHRLGCDPATTKRPSVVDLERLATDATARDIDPVTALAEVATVTGHGTDWITLAGGARLSLGVTGWHATLTSPRVETGTAWIGGRP